MEFVFINTEDDKEGYMKTSCLCNFELMGIGVPEE